MSKIILLPELATVTSDELLGWSLYIFQKVAIICSGKGNIPLAFKEPIKKQDAIKRWPADNFKKYKTKHHSNTNI